MRIKPIRSMVFDADRGTDHAGTLVPARAEVSRGDNLPMRRAVEAVLSRFGRRPPPPPGGSRPESRLLRQPVHPVCAQQQPAVAAGAGVAAGHVALSAHIAGIAVADQRAGPAAGCAAPADVEGAYHVSTADTRPAWVNPHGARSLPRSAGAKGYAA
jgi:hypothetical protein